MAWASGLARRLRSPRLGVALGVLAPVGMLALSAVMLLEIRRDAWDEAAQTSRNLLQVVENDIERNFEVIDLSLRGAVENMRAPGVAEANPALRQLMLFDRATTAQDIGVMLVIDETGEAIFDAASYPPRKINNADRDYFKAHKEHRDLGLVISRPLVSRLTGVPIVVLSRRINKPDGSFGGVALVSLKLSYFDRLFAKVGLGEQGAINLYLEDGTRLMRHPYVAADIGANIAGSATFDRFAREGRGNFIAKSVRDGVERRYEFTKVGNLPLILNVALATQDIEAEWRSRALVIGIVLFALCCLTISLSLLFGRELRRRAEVEAELACLSRTDALTGLANRRRFEELFAVGFDTARRRETPLGLLIVDADHFKRINDRFGHATGDEVLKGLAQCLRNSVHRPGDTVARIGGEEFAVLMPDTDEAGAARVAEKIHSLVSKLVISPAARGDITVSIGLAIGGPRGGAANPDGLYRLADGALYEAKEAGRNRTRHAKSPVFQEASAASSLRLVGPPRGA